MQPISGLSTYQYQQQPTIQAEADSNTQSKHSYFGNIQQSQQIQFARLLKKRRKNKNVDSNGDFSILKPAEYKTIDKKKTPGWKKVLKRIAAVLALPLAAVSAGGGYLGYNHHIRPHMNRVQAQQHVTQVETITDAQNKPIAILERVDGLSQSVMMERAQANTYVYGPKTETGKISFGSGFTVKGPDGNFYIITNNHVVDGNTINVEDGSKFMHVKMYGENKAVMAELLSTGEGEEVRSTIPDVAVLKLNENVVPAHYIDLSDFRDISAEPLEIGEPVFLVGNQSGLRDTVTTGIVSSTKEYRTSELTKFETLERMFKEFNFDKATTVFVQTDASCNGGGSGGALYDAEGRLIGIHTWHTDEFTNLCFSVRVDEVQKMFDEFGVFQHETELALPATVIGDLV